MKEIKFYIQTFSTITVPTWTKLQPLQSPKTKMSIGIFCFSGFWLIGSSLDDWFFRRKPWNRFAQVCHQQQKIRLLRGNAVKRLSGLGLKRAPVWVWGSGRVNLAAVIHPLIDINPDIPHGLDLSKHLHIPHTSQQTSRRSSSSGPHVKFNHELYEFVLEVQSKEKWANISVLDWPWPISVWA